jgi:hypothetical protein
LQYQQSSDEMPRFSAIASSSARFFRVELLYQSGRANVLNAIALRIAACSLISKKVGKVRGGANAAFVGLFVLMALDLCDRGFGSFSPNLFTE